MHRLLRIVMMWLLAVALPVQGVAAATMLACGPDHSPAALTHAHHDAASHGEHHDHAVAEQAADAGDSSVEVAAHKCSVCASCCTAAVLPTPALAVHAAVLPVFFALPVPAHVAVFLTDGPERPPRSLLV